LICRASAAERQLPIAVGFNQVSTHGKNAAQKHARRVATTDCRNAKTTPDAGRTDHNVQALSSRGSPMATT
jgi:hypothetical protein